MVFKEAPLTKEQRHRLAFGANAWAKYWDELCEHKRGRVLTEWVYPGKRDTWEARELAKRTPQERANLEEQASVRRELGWNNGISEQTERFQEVCETMAKGGKWANKAYIFYSVSKGPTTLALEARQLSSKLYSNKPSFVVDIKESLHSVYDADTIQPPIEESAPHMRPAELDAEAAMHTLTQPSKGHVPQTTERYGFVEEGVFHCESWTRQEENLLRETWRFATLRQIDGDGTVPLLSLIGFGGDVNVFKKLILKPNEKGDKSAFGPAHVDAPNHPWAWDRIIDVLQDTHQNEHFARRVPLPSTSPEEITSLPTEVDPTTGEDSDPRLHRLRLKYYQTEGAIANMMESLKK